MATREEIVKMVDAAIPKNAPEFNVNELRWLRDAINDVLNEQIKEKKQNGRTRQS